MNQVVPVTERHLTVSHPHGTRVSIIEDSVAEHGGRLTTLLCRYPRFIHSELMTHRVFSRNAASSRAIPVAKQLEQVKNDPAMPLFWGKNQKGMQAREQLSPELIEQARVLWLAGRDRALGIVDDLHDLDLHKQLANRLLEPWVWMYTLVTATEWDNHDALRDDSNGNFGYEGFAQPEYQLLAHLMVQARKQSTPKLLEQGEYHLPFVLPEEREMYEMGFLLEWSVARCARTSYANFDGTIDRERDEERHDALMSQGHMSPFEHQATPLQWAESWSGNFRGFWQYRKGIANEAVYQRKAS